MNTEYGKKIAGALRAVHELHSDTSKLLCDVDSKRLVPGWYSVFDNTATSKLTYHVKADSWMAEGVFRYYGNHIRPAEVEGLTACFFSNSKTIEEPILLVAQLLYRLPAGTLLRDICRHWDIWELYFGDTDKQELNKIIQYRDVDGGRIEWAKVCALPLYAIKQIEDVEKKSEEIRQS